MISYSPLSIPLAGGKRSLTLSRRDLFDARFQLISLGETEGERTDAKDEQEDKENALNFLDAPSDLVPGVYEGGLKTWECSLDLVDCLDRILKGDAQNLKGKRVLEVCVLDVSSVEHVSKASSFGGGLWDGDSFIVPPASALLF